MQAEPPYYAWSSAPAAGRHAAASLANLASSRRPGLPSDFGRRSVPNVAAADMIGPRAGAAHPGPGASTVVQGRLHYFGT
eukprot:761812-Hanusia_phi.AAC.3